MKNEIPHDDEAERALIGACLIEPQRCIPVIVKRLVGSEAFHDLRHKKIFAAINSMETSDVDCVTVNSAVGMFDYLNRCTEACFSTANLESWLEIVEEKHTLRKILKFCHEAIANVESSSPVGEIVDSLEQNVMRLRSVRNDPKSIKALLSEATHVLEHRAIHGDAVTGLPTGLIDLDKLTDGLHRGEMIVVAALPSCGKTALAVNVAMHNALSGNAVGILSAEMRPVQLVIRSVCAEARVNYKKISEEDCIKIQLAVGKIAKAPIYIEQVSGFTIGQIVATARRMKQAHGVVLIVIDYIQLLIGMGDNREQQVASVGRGIKQIAGELDIPVIALSQLNDDGKLRESRAIGQDADSVWLLSNDGDWVPRDQQVVLSVDKCRDGETGKVGLLFRKQYTRFESVSKVTETDYQSPHANE